MRDEPLDLPVTNPEEKSEEYLEGWEAHEWGVVAGDNPYDPGGERFRDWYRGWYEAVEAHRSKWNRTHDELIANSAGDLKVQAVIGKLADYTDWDELTLGLIVRAEPERRAAVLRAARGESVTDAGDTEGGAAGDVGVDPVPVDELDADLGQGTVRKTVRNLDQGAVAAIREITGASSDAGAVREAVLLAKDALVED